MIHQTDLSKAEELYRRNLGGLLQPPIGKEGRTLSDYELVPYHFEFEGETYKEATCDIVFPGLGWISVTGMGNIKIRFELVLLR